MRRLIPLLALAAIIALPAPTYAQENNPFQVASSLVDWFNELNTKWNKVVTREERAQFLRSLDRLHAGLVRLDRGTQSLLFDIRDRRPTSGQRRLLNERVEKLLQTVALVDQRTGVVEAQVALTDPSLPRRITETVSFRGATLRFLEEELDPRAPTWPATEIRARLTKALRLVRQSDDGVRAFRSKIARQH